jgi:predicted GIY-YIG superfamily endonuclease
MLQKPSSSLVYLIHFDQPYYHARHYLGTTYDLENRLRQHMAGRRAGGARLMEVIIQAGISWRVACTWVGGHDLERQLKAWHNHTRLCPICRAEQIADEMFATLAESEDEQTEQVVWYLQ